MLKEERKSCTLTKCTYSPALPVCNSQYLLDALLSTLSCLLSHSCSQVTHFFQISACKGNQVQTDTLQLQLWCCQQTFSQRRSSDRIKLILMSAKREKKAKTGKKREKLTFWGDCESEHMMNNCCLWTTSICFPKENRLGFFYLASTHGLRHMPGISERRKNEKNETTKWLNPFHTLCSVCQK